MIKRGLYFLLIFILCLCFASCGPVDKAVGGPNASVSEGFVAEISESFVFSDKAVLNPFMGFAPRSNSAAAPDNCSLYYVDVTFRELEPTEGYFDFAFIEQDNKLEQRRKNGQHIVFRFVCDSPGKTDHLDIPDWLYEKINGDGTHYSNEYGKGFSPNYENRLFIDAHKDAIEALGEHFGRDTFISYIELGSLGHWGEWHVKYSSGIERIPEESVREEYIKPYIAAFPNARILMRRPFKAAKSYGFGLYNDVAGDPSGTESWLDWIANGGNYNQTKEKDALVVMEDAWKTAPIGGEFTGSYTMKEMIKDNIEDTVSLIASGHMTFLGPKTPLRTDEQYAASDDSLYYDGADKIICTLGYRIGITKLEISALSEDGTAAVKIFWKNEGKAPLYFTMPVYLYVLSPDGNEKSKAAVEIDLTTLLPGETAETFTYLDLSSKTTGTTICIGIIDTMTQQPCVWLANNFLFKNGKNFAFTYK